MGEADKKESDAEREKDHAAFLEEEKDGNIPGASLLQLTTSDKLPMQAKSIISAFLGMSVNDEYEPPEANAYESQSGGIIEMLKKLKDEFRSKLSECQKEEMNSKNAYDMVQQDL